MAWALGSSVEHSKAARAMSRKSMGGSVGREDGGVPWQMGKVATRIRCEWPSHPFGEEEPRVGPDSPSGGVVGPHLGGQL